MEKIMRKTNLESRKVREPKEDRELQDDELEAVTGGIIAILIGLLLPDARPSTPPPPAGK
jgi:hypothetical protein